VVGAGLGGLAAAIKIALVGHQVTILEAAPQLAEVPFPFHDLLLVVRVELMCRLVREYRYHLIRHGYLNDGVLQRN